MFHFFALLRDVVIFLWKPQLKKSSSFNRTILEKKNISTTRIFNFKFIIEVAIVYSLIFIKRNVCLVYSDRKGYQFVVFISLLNNISDINNRNMLSFSEFI